MVVLIKIVRAPIDKILKICYILMLPNQTTKGDKMAKSYPITDTNLLSMPSFQMIPIRGGRILIGIGTKNLLPIGLDDRVPDKEESHKTKRTGKFKGGTV